MPGRVKMTQLLYAMGLVHVLPCDHNCLLEHLNTFLVIYPVP